MFADFAVLPQSVFSPARPPTSVRYEQKRVAKPATTKCEADQAAGDITTILGTDELTSVLVAVWETCANAPMCAAVSRRFKHASDQAKQLCKPLDVAPHRKQMKIAANDSMQPSAAADNATIESWGEDFENFVPRSGIFAPNMNDMQRILDVKGGGWLTNFAVDSYLSTFMPNVRAAMPGEPRVFLHSSTSVSLRTTGTLGFKAELPSGETDVDRTHELCAHAKSVLLGAQETYVNYNVDDKHWGLIRVHSQFKRCEIFDSTGHLKKKHGRELLNGYELLTGVDTSDWAVVVYESSASGMAQQKDGKSCGVFACITAAHLLHDAKLPDIQSKVVLWRRHIAVRIQTMPVVVVIRV